MGVYPSRDLFTASKFWFANNSRDGDQLVFMGHELQAKADAIRSFVEVQRLVSSELGGIDVTSEHFTEESMDMITLHRYFMFMQRQHQLVTMQARAPQPSE